MKDTDLVRYSRHIMLPEIDIEGQKKISSSKISIVGLGGLGCSASSFLAASGVGTLNLIDDDFENDKIGGVFGTMIIEKRRHCMQRWSE